MAYSGPYCFDGAQIWLPAYWCTYKGALFVPQSPSHCHIEWILKFNVQGKQNNFFLVGVKGAYGFICFKNNCLKFWLEFIFFTKCWRFVGLSRPELTRFPHPLETQSNSMHLVSCNFAIQIPKQEVLTLMINCMFFPKLFNNYLWLRTKKNYDTLARKKK